jgi:hypothetical protein
MPLVLIDLPCGKPVDYRRAVADVVYTAMTTVLAVPENDRSWSSPSTHPQTS